jgi:hypothetical protein
MHRFQREREAAVLGAPVTIPAPFPPEPIRREQPSISARIFKHPSSTTTDGVAAADYCIGGLAVAFDGRSSFISA